MTFEDWWEDYTLTTKHGLTTEDLKNCYAAGWDALADLAEGPTYEEVMSYERGSI